MFLKLANKNRQVSYLTFPAFSTIFNSAVHRTTSVLICSSSVREHAPLASGYIVTRFVEPLSHPPSATRYCSNVIHNTSCVFTVYYQNYILNKKDTYNVLSLTKATEYKLKQPCQRLALVWIIPWN